MFPYRKNKEYAHYYGKYRETLGRDYQRLSISTYFYNADCLCGTLTFRPSIDTDYLYSIPVASSTRVVFDLESVAQRSSVRIIFDRNSSNS